MWRLLLAAAFVALSILSPARGAQFALDRRDATIVFHVKTLGLLKSSGSFAQFDIRMIVDEAASDHGVLIAEIDMRSAAMSGDGATERLKGPSWFDVERFPQSIFTADIPLSDLRPKSRISGRYRLRDRVAPVALTILAAEPEYGLSGEIVAIRFRAEGAIDRLAYGMDDLKTVVSRKVGIEVNARLVRVEEGEYAP